MAEATSPHETSPHEADGSDATRRPGAVAALTRLNDVLARAILAIAAGGLVLMTLVIGWQIFGRYVLNDTPHWSERLSLTIMLYYILFGAAVGVRTGQHLGLSFATNALPPLPARIVHGAVQLAVMAFGLFMVRYGGSLMLSTWTHTIPTLGVSTAWSYLPFPVGGALIALFALENLVAPREVGPALRPDVPPFAAEPLRPAQGTD